MSDHNETGETHDGATCLVCRTFLGIAPVHPRIFAELHRPGTVPLPPIEHRHDVDCPVAICGWTECLCGAETRMADTLADTATPPE